MRKSSLLPLAVAFMLLACGLETEPSNPPASGGSGGSGGSDGGSGSGGSGAGGDSGTSGSGGSGGDGGGGTGGSTGGTGGTGGSTGGSGGSTPTDCDDDDECPPTSPVCDEGECGPCASSAACEDREATPFCEATAGSAQVGECVACLVDEHCEGNDDGEFCLNNECVPCKADSDCTDLSKPECNDKGQCVGCTSSEACEGRDGTEVCRTAVGAKRGHCVECLDHGDCGPEAPECKSEDNTCGACTGSEACEGRDGKTVCDKSGHETFGGTCVECTGTEYAVCEQGNVEYVCNGLERKCSTNAAQTVQSTNTCGECVSDAQCQTGKICVRHIFDDNGAAAGGEIPIGYFCTWLKDANPGPNGACSTVQPFVRTLEDATSVDGTIADVCTLRASSCRAYTDESSKNCGVPAGAPTEGDSSLCGHPDADNDGVCVHFDDAAYLCAMPCTGNVDCKAGVLCDLNATPTVCSLE